MRNTYWFAVDYNGTGHLFTCPPDRDTGMWTGEEALYIPKGSSFKKAIDEFLLKK